MSSIILSHWTRFCCKNNQTQNMCGLTHKSIFLIHTRCPVYITKELCSSWSFRVSAWWRLNLNINFCDYWSSGFLNYYLELSAQFIGQSKSHGFILPDGNQRWAFLLCAKKEEICKYLMNNTNDCHYHNQYPYVRCQTTHKDMVRDWNRIRSQTKLSSYIRSWGQRVSVGRFHWRTCMLSSFSPLIHMGNDTGYFSSSQAKWEKAQGAWQVSSLCLRNIRTSI